MPGVAIPAFGATLDAEASELCEFKASRGHTDLVSKWRGAGIGVWVGERDRWERDGEEEDERNI